MTRFMIVASVFLSALSHTAALKVSGGLLPTHPMPNSIHQQSPVLSVPEVSKVSPVPTASYCIVILCCQFVIVYTALALCRTYHELTGCAKGRLEAALRAAAQTLTYGPMISVLFIAYNMRVDHLSYGKGEPQAWVQKSMYAMTISVMASALLTLLIQLVTGKPVPKFVQFDLEAPREDVEYSKAAVYTLTVVRYVILLALYGGVLCMILGICTYLPPGAEKLSDVEAPGAALMCTMILAVVFFSTQLVITVCRSYSEITRVDLPQIVGVMHAASTATDFAPMLAILFLAARLHALQHASEPQEWAQTCMFVCTGAMSVTPLLASMVPMTLGSRIVKTNPWTKEVIVKVPKPMMGHIFIGLRYVCMLCYYGCAAAVMISIFAFEAPAPMETLPVSPAIQCVVNLTCQFFVVYFVMTVLLTVSELTGGTIPLEQWSLFSAIESARSTLSLAPMLSIVCITTRMYALSITDNRGAPPARAQDAMDMATCSLQISGLMCLGTGSLMAKVETDDDGNVVNKFTNWYVGRIVVAIRYTSMLLLYGGMAIVIAGLFTMTPESATGRDSLLSHVAHAVSGAPRALQPSAS